MDAAVIGTGRDGGPPAGDRVAGGIPDEAVGDLLGEADRLPYGHPRRAWLRARAVELALPAAHRLARRYRGGGEPDDDLRQVAALGLVKAVNGFDVGRGHQFSDYAVPTILGELRRHFRDHGWSVRVSRRIKDLYVEIRAAASELAQRLQRSPTVADLCEALALPAPVVAEALAAVDSYRPVSLQMAVGDGTQELGDLVGGADPRLELVDDWLSVRPMLASLPRRSQQVLAMRFWGNMTQSDIGAQLGLSQVHVSRILKETVATLRQGLDEG
jgi:RNA polymerase sigma-B factor